MAFQGNRTGAPSPAGKRYRGFERPADQTGSVKLRTQYARSALTKYGSGAGAGTSVGSSTSCSDTGVGANEAGWAWPVKGNIRTGNCWNEYVSGLGRHAGMDINSTINGNEAIVAHAGTVVQVRTGVRGFSEAVPTGNYVMIKTDGDKPVYYAYQHLASVSLSLGQPVKVGEKVGIIGVTGRVYDGKEGHLHFTVAVSATVGSYGNNGQTRDPMDYLPKENTPSNYKCS